MPSKRSYFNATLYRKNLSRFWPLWGGVSLMGCVAPLYLLLRLVGTYRLDITANMMTATLYSAVTAFVPGFLLVYAALCGVLTWSYLNSPRSVGLYHTLPVDRTNLYLTTLLSGLTMMVLPFAIVGGLTVLVAAAFGILDFSALLTAVAAVLGQVIFFYAAAAFAAMITGNSFAMLVFYFLGNFLAVILEGLITSFARGFYVGVEQQEALRFTFLSPMVYLYQKVGCAAGYTAGEERFYYIEGLWLIGVYALLGLALLALAWLLYRRRRSECAGDVVAQRWLKPVFRFGLAVFSGLTLGQVLYQLLYALPFNVLTYVRFFPMLLSMVITSILGYYAASMLLKKSLRVFRDWKGPVVTIVLAALLCTGAKLDVFGVETYLPARENVAFLNLTVGGEAVSLSPEDPLYEKAAALHQIILEHREELKEEQNRVSYTAYDENGSQREIQWVRFGYCMESGGVTERSYRLPLDREDWQESRSYEGAYRAIVEDPRLEELRLTFGGLRKLSGGTVEFPNAEEEWQSYELSTRELEALQQALLSDAAAGRLTADIPFSQEKGTLELAIYLRSTSLEEERSVSELYLQVTPDMTDTLRMLLEEEILTQADLDLLLERAGLMVSAAEGDVDTGLPDTEQA